jgi:S1-C subfamily serine protease
MTHQRKYLTKWLALIAMGLISIGLLIRWLGSRTNESSVQPTRNHELQSRVQLAIEHASPAVVAIANGSGSIISADGLILSQSHVTHDGRSDGDKVKVVLADGTAMTATLVAHTTTFPDVSLSKIDGSGPFPYLKLTKRSVQLGDYVIKLGHPSSWHPVRGLVARLGRIVSTEPGSLVSDCLTMGGDSGGPFVDLDGELIGMIEGSVGLLPGNSVHYELHSAVAASRLSRLAPVDRTGRIKVATGPHAFTITPVVELASIVNRLKTEGSYSSPRVGSIPEVVARSGHWPPSVVSDNVLPYCDWMNGSRHSHRIAGRVGGPASMMTQYLTEIAHEGKRQCLGVFVDDQHVVARASLLPRDFTAFKAHLSQAKEPIELKLVSINESLDLALLKGTAQKFAATIDWADESPGTGAVLIARGIESERSMIGIVSVGLRRSDKMQRQSLAIGGLYDAASLPDGEFPSYLDTDIHLYVDELGIPVVDIEGKCVGIAIRASHIGTRLIPAKEITKWLTFAATGGTEQVRR